MRIIKDLVGAVLLSAVCLLGTALDSHSQLTHAAISQSYQVLKQDKTSGIKIYNIRTFDEGKSFTAVTESGHVVKLTNYDLINALPAVDYDVIEFFSLKCEVVCWDDRGYVVGAHPQWESVDPELLPILKGHFDKLK